MTPGDKRRKNAQWTVGDGNSVSVSGAEARLAVLLDIRDELQENNRLLDLVRKQTNRIPPRVRRRR